MLGVIFLFIYLETKLSFGLIKINREKQGKRLNKLMVAFDKLKFEQLTLLIANPFTPAFMINIVAGLSSMKKRKFI